MRLITLAFVAVAAAGACSAPAGPSIRPPDPPPAEAGEFPALISGAQAWLEERSNRCEPRAVETGVAIRCVADYRGTPDDYYGVVDVVAGEGGFITLVQATVDVGRVEDPGLAGHLGYYADTVLRIVADPAPDSAVAWLRDHVTSPGSIIVGSLVLEMTVDRTRASLRIWQQR